MIIDSELTAARNAVTKRVLCARTLPQILEAWQLLQTWIKAHPEDEGMRDGFEQLSLMQDIAEEQSQTKPKPRAREGILTR